MPTILVADDNSNIQKMVANALRERGIDVIGVANGDAAVKKLEILNPDMVLADVFMPVKDGYELCEWIKGNDRLAAVPVFLLVGAFDPLDEHRVQSVKADGVLKKPFVPTDHLIGAVSAMLERVARSRAAAEMLSHSTFASSAPQVEDTQQLSEAEVAEITGQPPPPPAPAVEPEPEMDVYTTRPSRLSFDQAEQPLGFDDVLGSSADPETESESHLGFEASSASGMGFTSPAHDDGAAGIMEEARQPAPDAPPIKVEFGDNGGADLELITSDNAAGMAEFSSMSSPLAELVGSGESVEPAEPVQDMAPSPASRPMSDEIPIPEVRLPEPEPEPLPEPEAAPAPVEMASADLPQSGWSEPDPDAAFAAPPQVYELPSMEDVVPSPAVTAAQFEESPALAAPVDAPELAPRAMALSQAQQDALVDEIVDRVVSQIQPMVVHRVTSEIGKGLETLQPQLLERITKEVIRPLAEDMFRKKTEN
ncbi:MAG: response regulator [Candidatus Acidiferrales bacterium]